MSTTKERTLLPEMILYRNESHEDETMQLVSSLMFQLAEDRVKKELYSSMAFPVNDEGICYIIFDPLTEKDSTIVFSTIVDEKLNVVQNGSEEDSIRIYKRKDDAYNYVNRMCKVL